MTVSGVRVAVVRKAIKNLHLGVYPPDGRVRVAAPLALSDAAVRVAVISRLAWIKRQQASFRSQARESVREMVSGESHYYLGRRYRLRVIEGGRVGTVVLRNRRTMEVHVPAGRDSAYRRRVLQRWYRERLRHLAEPIIARWEERLGVDVAEWGIKRMKTKWGSCTHAAGRVWLNLELAKKPLASVEYVIVHELVHLIEPSHNERFVEAMDRAMPTWRHRRRVLNAEPVGYAGWGEC